MRGWIRTVGMVALGLALGVGLGLYLGWIAWPTQFTDAAPTILQERYREDYALMVADAYALDGDLPAARARLSDLGPGDGQVWFLEMTVDAILSGRDEAEIRRLVALAHDLGLRSPAMAPYLPEEAP